MKICEYLSAYFEICKPRVVWLMLVTAYVGMQLASPGVVPWMPALWGLLGIGLMASSAAAINHIVDRHIDAGMARTQRRPLPTGKLSTINAASFASVLGLAGFLLLICKVNLLTALLTFGSLMGYAVIYTMFLKRMTPQNIVWGGLAGAMPPMLGWTAITGQFDWESLILVAIIFIWTPPHFWALAIYRFNEYQKIKEIPMLPITHGIPYTKNSIVVYSVLLFFVALLPVLAHLSGWVYLIGSLVLSSLFLYYALRLKYSENPIWGRTLFRYSITYLLLLFILMFVDRFL